METAVGGITNKFKIKSRRVTFFFEDILAEYIQKCDVRHGNRMEEIGKRWCTLCVRELSPVPLEKLPFQIAFRLMKIIWTNIGILDDITFVKNNDEIMLQAKGNTITRIIGKNNFATGCFIGILTAILSSKIECIRAYQDKEAGEKYLFRIEGKKIIDVPSKKKEEYNNLNSLQKLRGFTLKDAVKKKIFQIKGNRIFFRGKSICNSENTLFHIIGNENILLDRVPEISYNYFKEVVELNAGTDNKLTLLKNLLQIMGWGTVRIIKTNEEIIMNINDPPYGLQTEKENWNFLAKVILGYLWLIHKDLRIKTVKEGLKNLKIVYAGRTY